MIGFTSDIDWAPEEVISDMLSLLEKYNIKCTLFCTHESEVIKNCNRNLFEIAIHPNFNQLLDGKGGSIDKIIDDLLHIYPEAKGVRSHSMTQNTTILNKFAEKGILYDSNHFLPYQTGIKPFKLWNGMMRIPYNWEDDIHWLYGKSFDNLDLDLMSAGIHVLDFHPIHVFANKCDELFYKEIKPWYHNYDELLLRKNTNKIGTRNILIGLLEKLKYNNVKTFWQKEIMEL